MTVLHYMKEQLTIKKFFYNLRGNYIQLNHWSVDVHFLPSVCLTSIKFVKNMGLCS